MISVWLMELPESVDSTFSRRLSVVVTVGKRLLAMSVLPSIVNSVPSCPGRMVNVLALASAGTASVPIGVLGVAISGVVFGVNVMSGGASVIGMVTNTGWLNSSSVSKVITKIVGVVMTGKFGDVTRIVPVGVMRITNGGKASPGDVGTMVIGALGFTGLLSVPIGTSGIPGKMVSIGVNVVKMMLLGAEEEDDEPHGADEDVVPNSAATI